MQETASKTVKTTLAITGVVIFSKIIGFVRAAVMANFFGASIRSDAYTLANGLLYMATLLFSSCIASTFIPIYIKAERDGGLRSANDYASKILTLFACIGLAISLLGMAFAPALTQIIAAQYDAPTRMLTAQLVRLMFAGLTFSAIANVLCSVLNARQRFLFPQLMGLALSGCVIVSCVFFSKTYDIYAVAVGAAAVGFVQVLILLPALRGQFSYRPQLDVRDDRVKRTFLLALPALLGMAVNELNFFVDRYLAGGLAEGSVASLSYAYNLLTMVTGICVVPLVTIMFSKMSRYAARGDKKAVGGVFKQCLVIVALILLPITGIAIVMNEDIIRIVYERGEFGAQAALLTRTALVFYISGVFFFGMREVLGRTFYSMQDTKTPMFSGIVSVACNIVLNIILVKVMGIGGLALSTSIASFVGCVQLMIYLRHKLGPMGMKDTILQLIRVCIATGLCVVATIAALRYLPLQSTSTLTALVRLIVCAATGLITYMAAVLIMRVREVYTLVEIVQEKVPRRHGR